MAIDSQDSESNYDPPTEEHDGVLDIVEEEELTPYSYDITSYGADFLVDGLVLRLKSGDIEIPTFDPEGTYDDRIEGFQRRFVWTKPQMDRFIESLLLGLPIPGIFLVKLEPSNVLLVLDGQQRLRTLLAFYEGVVGGRVFKLEQVQPQFRGRTYPDLEEEDRRRLDNSVIHATIIRQDEPSDDYSSIYLIFERLNTGGTTLQPQEIRVALYHGSFARLLRDLNDNEAWRQLSGGKSKRIKDQELILRFFAMFFDGEEYVRPLKGFLNEFMASNRDLQRFSEEQLKGLFERTTLTVLGNIGARAFRPRGPVNAAVVDSLMVGVAKRVEQSTIQSPELIKEAYERLLRDETYLAAVEKSTAGDESVKARLQLASQAFADVT